VALAGRHYASVDELGFCLVVDPPAPDDVDDVKRRLHLTARVEKGLRDLVRLRELSAKLAASADSPAEAVELQDGRSKSAMWALSLLDRGPAGETARRYLSEWQQVKPALTGNDLLAIGVAPGERVGALLRQVRAARLTGEVTSREEEVALVQRELAGGSTE
jgi:tRNA nucleotidyltransferase (CCA-adding enzyme)